MEAKLKHYFEPKFALITSLEASLSEMVKLLSEPEKKFVDSLFEQQTKFIDILSQYSFFLEPDDREVDHMAEDEFSESVLNMQIQSEDVNYLKQVLFDLCQLKPLQFIDFSQSSIEFIIEIKKSIAMVRDLIAKSVDSLAPSV